MRNKGNDEFERIGGWGKSIEWAPPELIKEGLVNKDREVCLELIDVYWVGHVAMRIMGMTEEEIYEI